MNNLIRPILIISSSVILIFVAFLLLFYSDILANNNVAIKIRREYFLFLENKFGYGSYFYSAIPFESLPKQNGKNVYRYRLTGEFVSIDYSENVITIRDFKNKLWRFSFDQLLMKGVYESKLTYMLYEYNHNKLTSSKSLVLTINNNDIQSTTEIFSPGDNITIFWADTSNISELKNKQSTIQIINLVGSGVIPVNKIINNKNE